MLSDPSDDRAIVAEKHAGERWYVVHTQPNAEGIVMAHLESQGYRVFCPRYCKAVRHARKTKRVLAPLFPNYLFLRLDITRDQWRFVNSTRGVVRLIMQGVTPQPVPRGIVEVLQTQLGTDDAMSWAAMFKIGQAVRILDGPFVNIVGTLQHLDPGGRVRVLLDMLGRSVSLALRCDTLTSAV
jgi:transcription elongation factor/antiterminator RfaH